MKTVLDLRKRPVSEGGEPAPPTAFQPDPGFFNRKSATPSEMMLPPEGGRYRCSWLEHGLTVHADGNATCGLDDPYSRRSFGNVNRQSVAEIWANPE